MYMLAIEESGEKTWNSLWIKENMNLTFKGFPDDWCTCWISNWDWSQRRIRVYALGLDHIHFIIFKTREKKWLILHTSTCSGPVWYFLKKLKARCVHFRYVKAKNKWCTVKDSTTSDSCKVTVYSALGARGINHSSKSMPASVIFLWLFIFWSVPYALNFTIHLSIFVT